MHAHVAILYGKEKCCMHIIHKIDEIHIVDKLKDSKVWTNGRDVPGVPFAHGPDLHAQVIWGGGGGHRNLPLFNFNMI